ELEDALPHPRRWCRPRARGVRHVRRAGRIPRVALARGRAATRPVRVVGDRYRVRRVDLPPHPAREHAARTRGAGGLPRRIRRALCDSGPVPGGARPAHTGSAGHARAGTESRRLRRADPAAQGNVATMRSGPPLPPRIFIGSAITNAPVAGTADRCATFSNAGMSAANKIWWVSNV